MPFEPLAPEILKELGRFNSPTISNAIETFNVRPRHLGFLPHTIRCLFPDMPPIVGYAVTSQTRASFSPDKEPDLTADYLRYVAAQPGAKIAVGQDLDDPPGLGAQFGEVNATIHKKLGCIGHITDGCPRDLDEVRPMDFQFFGRNPCVSHAYVRLAGFGKPVKLAGSEILPGDLIHADKHGVCVIPIEIAAKLAEACREVERLEKPLLDLCKSAAFDLEEYIRLRSDMKAKIRE